MLPVFLLMVGREIIAVVRGSSRRKDRQFTAQEVIASIHQAQATPRIAY